VRPVSRSPSTHPLVPSAAAATPCSTVGDAVGEVSSPARAPAPTPPPARCVADVLEAAAGGPGRPARRPGSAPEREPRPRRRRPAGAGRDARAWRATVREHARPAAPLRVDFAAACGPAWRPTAGSSSPSASRRSRAPTGATPRPGPDVLAPCCARGSRRRGGGPGGGRVRRPSTSRVPLRPLGERYLLELFHGPTLAFKDVAARTMARWWDAHACCARRAGDRAGRDLGRHRLRRRGRLRGHRGLRVVVLYPAGREPGAGAAARRAAAGRRGVRRRGDFDDCQRLVKAALVDPALARAPALDRQLDQPRPPAAADQLLRVGRAAARAPAGARARPDS
jgi:hypothetical protein